MKCYDVVLISPPWTKLEEGFENLGLGYISSSLRKNNIKDLIINAPLLGWNESKVLHELIDIECKLIGVSIPFQDAAPEILNLIAKIKKQKPSIHITVGGIYPTFAYEELLHSCSAIDTIVIGEGEETSVELATALINGDSFTNIKGLAYKNGQTVVKTETRPSVENLDVLPFPSRDTLQTFLSNYNHAPMITSRGCYARCSFCSVVSYYSGLGKSYRMRSAENVLDEIEYLYHNYGVRNIVFNDANFIGGSINSKERSRKIANEIIKRNLNIKFSIQCRVNDIDEELFTLLKQAGLIRVFLGIESGSQPVLDRFKKDITVDDNLNAIKILSLLDIYVVMGFIMFDDRTNITELNDNIMFLNNVKKILKKDKMSPVYPASKLLPLSGTEFESHLKKDNNYYGNSLKYSYKFKDPFIKVLFTLISTTSRISSFTKSLSSKKPESNMLWDSESNEVTK